MIKIYIRVIIGLVIAGMVLLFVLSNTFTGNKVANEYILYDKNMHVYVISKEQMEEQVSELNEDASTSTNVGSYSVAEHAKPYIEWIFKYAKQYDVDPILVCAMCAQETDFGTNIKVSSAGAKGLMQFTDPTWAEYMPGEDVNNPEKSIEGACKYIRKIRDIIGTDNLADVAAAYNCGPYGYTVGNPKGKENVNYYNEVPIRYQAYKNGSLSIGYKYKEGDIG